MWLIFVLHNVTCTLLFICLGVSVRKIDVLESLADILVWAPCSAGKNEEWRSAGLW
jgi:hypothetical protein